MFAHASLALVEPLLATDLLFALPLSARWHRRVLSPREWVGVFAIIAGLAAFLGAGQPGGGSDFRLPGVSVVATLTLIALVVASLVLLGRRSKAAAREATALASAAGVLYGLQDALTQRLVDKFHFGLIAGVLSWNAFVLIVVAVIGMLLGQSSFEAAPLTRPCRR